MILGILSDSHGRAETTRRAVDLLRQSGATLLLHLGDVGSEAVIDELVGYDARIIFGNCDWDVSGLTRYAAHVGVSVDHPLREVTIGGRRVIYTHGDREILMRQAVAAKPHYLLHGHTHEVRDERRDGTRIINPGALFRAARYTAAILEPESDRLEFVEVQK